MYNRLFASLDQTTTVITVTRRLSNFLSTAFNSYQQDNNVPTETPVDIIPIGDWLKRCWYEYTGTDNENIAFLLSPAHEFAIWQQIIRHSAIGDRLLQFNATTELAKQAWQLAKQWQLALDAPAFSQTEDTAIWQSWAKKFIDQCAQNNWLDANSLPEKILELLQQQKFHQQKIVLVGFDELNPQYQLLFKQLVAHGYTISQFTPEPVPAQITGIKLNDSTLEVEQMARWARQIRQQQPKKSIGCIIPNLNEIRADVINSFTEILMPAANLPGHSAALPFNLANHFILSQYALVRMAFALLGLHKTVEFNTVSTLLRSPYLGYAEQEICARAKLDVELRKQGTTSFSIRELFVFAKKNHCEHLANLFKNYLITIPAELTKLYPSQWADLFTQQLTTLGWPGERSLNSTEYQLVERWQELLVEFAQFDQVLHQITIDNALLHLQQIASNTLYQPQSTGVNIHILTPLEAAGLQFDYLWVMGLHDNAWPPAANANPFLPITLQRQYKLPHASSEQELHFYRQITQQLVQSACEVVLSYPQFNEDRALRPSALINDLADFKESDLHLPSCITLIEQIRNASNLESYEDHAAPELNAAEKIMGGSAIFKYQAACPFRAFAQFRLGTQALPTPHGGLNAKERGSIMHRTLEIIWRQLNDSKQLMALPDEALVSLIQRSIDSALVDFIKLRPHIFKERFTKIEQARLQNIISQWLKLEKQRPPFAVHAIEETYQTQIADIPLRIRVDRIDRLSDGNYVIFDYKTSLASINYWFSDRPDDPQLPLYTSTSTLPITGMAFALIRSNSVQFKGISANDAEITGVTPIDKLSADLMCNDWPMLVTQWRRVLMQLGEQFASGQAHCDPKNGQQTCKQCDLQTFCRITEQSQL